MARYNIKRDLAEFVKAGLEKTGQTQRQLADNAGTTTKHVTMVLNGRSNASVEMGSVWSTRHGKGRPMRRFWRACSTPRSSASA